MELDSRQPANRSNYRAKIIVAPNAVPFPCHWVEDAWRSMKSEEKIEAAVIGWRTMHKI